MTDDDVRVHLYASFVATGEPPTVASVSRALALSEDDARAAIRRLASARVLVLQPGADDIWMLNPLSAVRTSFAVEAAGHSYYGNCIWDALGIAAMLHADARITTVCPDCDHPLELAVRGTGVEASAPCIAHFAVPASQWWDDIGFT